MLPLKDALKLIPADNLYWNEISNSYNTLSGEEIEKIIFSTIESGQSLILEQLTELVNVFNGYRLSNILLNELLKGNIYATIDEDGEIYWKQK